ncbi:MAG: aspartate kinase [Candidatus Aenigmarchaeota archaeon]|nr:aspartate kinase [Candidatus Aenigmarchaeota archaeon]
MTTIIKAGGSSVTRPERLAGGYVDGKLVPGIFPQIYGMDDKIIFITSAQGETTNRIKKFICDAKTGKSLPEPEDLFADSTNFGLAYEPDSQARRYSILTEIDKVRKDPETRKQLDDNSYVAMLHLMGERIAAIDAYELARQSGINCALIDLADERFPLTVKGDYMNASIDFPDSRRRTYQMLQQTTPPLLILPGYGGMNRATRKGGILARGGSDRSAIALQYAAQAGSLGILTNVAGIKTADRDDADTVPVLSLAHAKAAANLGAKLPGSKSLEGLEMRYDENEEPEVYIAHSQDISGNKTNIVKTAEEGRVLLVAGRRVDVYTFEGNISGLEDTLRGRNVEYTTITGTADNLSIAVPYENRDHTELVLGDYMESKHRKTNGIKMEYEGEKGHIGIVGGVRNTKGMLEASAGAVGRAGINIEYGADPSRNSIGFIIGQHDISPGIQTLYNRFFPKK